MLEGLRGEENISELCRREGIAASMYYGWSKEFLEAGKRRLWPQASACRRWIVAPASGRARRRSRALCGTSPPVEQEPRWLSQ
ncbi:transposase [Nitrobacter sp. Nb-311A]|nr:transposase [Nitrobacter sp. Nb-311A]